MVAFLLYENFTFSLIYECKQLSWKGWNVYKILYFVPVCKHQLRNLGVSISFVLVKQSSVVLAVLGQACRKDSARLGEAHLRRKSRNTYLLLLPQQLFDKRTGVLFHMQHKEDFIWWQVGREFSSSLYPSAVWERLLSDLNFFLNFLLEASAAWPECLATS